MSWKIMKKVFSFVEEKERIFDEIIESGSLELNYYKFLPEFTYSEKTKEQDFSYMKFDELSIDSRELINANSIFTTKSSIFTLYKESLYSEYYYLNLKSRYNKELDTQDKVSLEDILLSLEYEFIKGVSISYFIEIISNKVELEDFKNLEWLEAYSIEDIIFKIILVLKDLQNKYNEINEKIIKEMNTLSLSLTKKNIVYDKVFFEKIDYMK